jgi:5-methylcytosine-specific restriction enzyme subunit McrC
MTKLDKITVFEHQTLKLNKNNEQSTLLKALQNFYGEKGVPYFSLINDGVKFKEYVGVIQVGKTVIEVLPKADDDSLNEKKWRGNLIKMLFAVEVFDVHAPSISNLNLTPNSILDLYFELFILEVEYLVRKGLLRQYRQKNDNVTALKGKLLFGKHIQKNIVHKERFYVSHSTYDFEHKLHIVIYKTILLINRLNTNIGLQSRIGALLLNFPEMPDMKITETLFDKFFWNRKNVTYKKAIEISKLLLLQYHPDVCNGRNNVLALMFDMNKLWEKFVFLSLRKANKSHEMKISRHISKLFWKSKSSYSKMIPDIVLTGVENGESYCVVLDTKWKVLNSYKPSIDDLRQMYVYHEYYGAKKVALLYPGIKNYQTDGSHSGFYLNPDNGEKTDKECGVICSLVNSDLKKWQEQIYDCVEGFIKKEVV